jgi:hypothetical protein
MSVCDLAELLKKRAKRARAPHVLCAGMNPGAVNLWVRLGIERHGVPREIVHFEYDTSTPDDGWHPMVTWCRRQFLAETVWEPTGWVNRGRSEVLSTNALHCRVDMRPILAPVWRRERYPEGMLVLHEENLLLGKAFGVSSKFIYAVPPRLLHHLTGVSERQDCILETELRIGDNTRHALRGRDTVGVYLEYPRRRVYYLNSVANRRVSGTNATCAQVAASLLAALRTLVAGGLRPRIYFPEELHDSMYRDLLLKSLAVSEYLFVKRGGHLAMRARKRLAPRPGALAYKSASKETAGFTARPCLKEAAHARELL